jgi:predicted AlkP superfamily phosphohydrolase/phosphomutase
VSRSGARTVLAIGVDAAEPTLLRGLIERGELPVLGALRARGAWRSVTSPAPIGSGAVWPTFITGVEPLQHGVYGEWCWRPATMSLDRWHSHGLAPFWVDVDRRGLTVGVLDVPFAPLVGLARGFEISEWGPHDVLVGHTEISPPGVGDVVKEIGRHPFASGRVDATGPEDHDALTELGAACLAGVTLRGRLAARLIETARPDLAVIVFPEIHTASHHLWHTIATPHPFYADARFRPAPRSTPGLLDVVRELDRQIGVLVDRVGPDAAVFVFGLHGMEPTRGIPDVLGPWLDEAGFARLRDWRTQSWGERAQSLFAALKRRTPRALKRLYYLWASREFTHRVAHTTVLPAYDWQRTRAFSLPTDQHGWIRVNLAGREREGIVAPGGYADTCRELTDLLRALITDDGRPIVRDVMAVAQLVGGGPPANLPDLVVHWDDAAFDDPLRLARYATRAAPIAKKFTGQHRPDGFCLANGAAAAAGDGSPVPAQRLHRLMVDALGR